MPKHNGYNPKSACQSCNSITKIKENEIRLELLRNKNRLIESDEMGMKIEMVSVPTGRPST
ncbi:hypothetical protein FRX31_019170 [Thalictrum thalictroides]|uniref:Uncharacterized protein n=1 Tax=Thalictrum thalictroides TaxID=46969 RepID=A0A7J6W409_THATH|nr:hypothetical protein FRX31_019170 [Thalictrum thalictroides]